MGRDKLCLCGYASTRSGEKAELKERGRKHVKSNSKESESPDVPLMMAVHMCHACPLCLGQIPWPLILGVLCWTTRDLSYLIAKVLSSPNTS